MSLTAQWPAAAGGAALGGLAGLLMRDVDLPALVSFDHSREPLVLAAAVAGAIVACTRIRPLLVAAVVVLAGLWLAVAFTPLSSWLSAGLARYEAVEPADAVLVSFSALRPDAQRLAEIRNRVFTGIDLVARGKAARMVVTDSSNVPGLPVAREMIEGSGPDLELVVAGRADNTREEAVAVGTLMRQRGWKTLLLVTSPIHSRRACAAMQQEGIVVISAPSRDTRFDIENLGTPTDRLAAFGSVMHERLGLWVYERRGWMGGSAAGR